MRAKYKPTMTKAEREHVAQLASQPCAVCDAPGPSEVHEPHQGLWMAAIPLCPECHRGGEGWHGTRLRWKLRKVSELCDFIGAWAVERGVEFSEVADVPQ